MAVLSNARWELVAQNLATGSGETDAHEMAGYKRNRGNASSMCSKPEIRERVRELQTHGAVRAEVDCAWVLKELVEVHKIAMTGQPVLDRYGKPTGGTIKNLSAANRAGKPN